MIHHLFKMVWQQRRKNSWISLELFFVFIIIWYILDFFVSLGLNSRIPQGCDIEDTYLLNYGIIRQGNPRHIEYEEESGEPARNLLRIVERLRNYPGVVAVSYGDRNFPYDSGSSSSSFKHDSLRTQCSMAWVTPDFFRVFRVQSKDGGNSTSLEQAIQKGYILSKEAEEKLFRNQSAVGQRIFETQDDSTGNIVYGVSSSYKRSEYETPTPFIYIPFDEAEFRKKSDDEIWEEIKISFRVKQGTPSSLFLENFEKDMKTQLNSGNFFFSDLQPLSKIRAQYLKSMKITSSVQYRAGLSVFFLINIFLGILGTFWLRIERRKSEIGLRMAVGSSRKSIMGMMQGESFLLLLIAAIPALVVCLNLAYFEVLSKQFIEYSALRFILNTVFTFVLLGIVIALGTWYPARRSSRIQPAEALHYE